MGHSEVEPQASQIGHKLASQTPNPFVISLRMADHPFGLSIRATKLESGGFTTFFFFTRIVRLQAIEV